MPVVTVRNLSEETHRALKLRAAQHGRSIEAEIIFQSFTLARPTTFIMPPAHVHDLQQRFAQLPYVAVSGDLIRCRIV